MNEPRRFSDSEMIRFRTEVDLYMKNAAEKEKIFEQRIISLEIASRENTAILRELRHDTKGIIQLCSDFQGAARIGGRVKRVLMWVSGIGVAGASVATAVKSFLER